MSILELFVLGKVFALEFREKNCVCVAIDNSNIAKRWSKLGSIAKNCVKKYLKFVE